MTCAVVVDKDGISLVGQPKPGRPVVLENAGGQDMGVAFAKTGDPTCLTDDALRIHGALVRGLEVDGFEGEGVLLFCADDWRVTGVSANDNGEYGIFPSHVGHGPGRPLRGLRLERHRHLRRPVARRPRGPQHDRAT